MELIFFNRVYRPSLEATSILISELTQALSREFRVKAVCATPASGAEPPGTAVVRRPGPQPGRSPLRRLVVGVHYFVQCLKVLATSPRGAVAVVWTDPPLLDAVLGSFCALTRRPFVAVVQDLYPEVIGVAGALPPPVVALLKAWHRAVLRRAAAVVCISPDTIELLADSGVRNTVEISNWAAKDLEPAPKARERRWATTPFADRTIVKYAGNVGYACDLRSFAEALRILPHPERFLFLFQVSGRQMAAVHELAREHQCVQVAEPVPRAELADSLAACDAHLVLTPESMFGLVYASKLFSAAAAGMPVVASAPRRSAMQGFIRDAGIGFAASARDPKGLVQAFEDLDAARRRGELPEIGARARRLAETKFSAQTATDSYAALFRRVASQAKKPPSV